MKKVIKYSIYGLFLGAGVSSIVTNPQFSFFWWLGAINVAGWGGLLLFKLFDFLEE